MEKLDNYKKEKLTINLGWAYIFGILILIPIALIFGLPYYMLWMDSIDVKNILYDIAPDDVAHSDIFVFCNIDFRNSYPRINTWGNLVNVC